MGNWPALLAAPSLALTNLSVTYALTTPACARQSMLAPNLVCAASLVACAWMSWGAWRNWQAGRRAQGAAAGASDAAPDRSPFLALVATMVGALSCLVVLAQWFPQWILSPCAS
jgi:TRAP-type C4-dicarboxylate transport system permease small subunit